MWENLKFLKKDDSHGNRAMGREEISLVCADLVQITFDSLKYQFIGKVRVIPPITRLFYPESGGVVGNPGNLPPDQVNF
jgi:hypothetical protein